MSSASSSSSSSSSIAPGQLYADRYRDQLSKDLDLHLIPDLAKICLEYATLGEFGPKEWEKVWGVRVEQLKLGSDYSAWRGDPDAIDEKMNLINPNHKIRKNSETHFPPVLIPETVTPIDLNVPAQPMPYSLEVLNQLAKNPREGFHPSQFSNDNAPALQQNKNKVAGKAHWVCARKEVVGRGETKDEQIANFGPLPSALAVSTVVQALRAIDPDNRYLGDSTGIEKHYTEARTCDEVTYGANTTCPVTVGGNAPLVVGAPGPSGGLCVGGDYRFDVDFVGVAVLRKFEDN